MNPEVLRQTFTFCKRIGKLTLGFDVVKAAILTGEANLVLFASDLSPKSRNQIEYLCREYEVTFVLLPYTMDECWYLIGKRAGIIAVTEESFAEKLQELLSNTHKGG